MTQDIISKCESVIADAIVAIQQPRTDFELRHFVIGQHDTEPRRYAQCVLEIQIKLQSMRRARILRRQTNRRIESLRKRGTPAATDKAELLQIDLEDQRLAVLGAYRELEALYAIFQSFSRHYSRDELNAAECEYWKKRLIRQAGYDVNASGRVGVGNQDALRQIGLPAAPAPEYITSVEQRFLEGGDSKIVVVVPTLLARDEVKANGLNCLRGWTIPGSFRHMIHIVDGRPIAAAYNAGVQWALDQGADFVLCVEDDHLVPPGAFEGLWRTFLINGPKVIVGAWYPQRRVPRTGAPLVLHNGHRMHLEDDGGIHDVYTVPQGFTLIPTHVFREIPQPWFVTTECLTQDSFFSQLAREAGYRLLVDTSIRCSHVDRQTGKIYD